MAKTDTRTHQIKLEDIRMDGGTQPRAAINDEIVSEYVEAIEAGAVFPPVTLFFDGKEYWLADGFHRACAFDKAGAKTIQADVRQGTQRDAVLFSVSANAAHGVRRTNPDKRRAVLVLLNDEEWGKWSSNKIAKMAAVGHQLVDQIRASLAESSSEPRQYTTKHGTVATMRTENIGHGHKAATTTEIVDGDSGEVIANPKRIVTKEEYEAAEVPQIRGVGLDYAYKAIAILKQIPINDGLRVEALERVAIWVRDNK